MIAKVRFRESLLLLSFALNARIPPAIAIPMTTGLEKAVTPRAATLKAAKAAPPKQPTPATNLKFPDILFFYLRLAWFFRNKTKKEAQIVLLEKLVILRFKLLKLDQELVLQL